MTPSPVTPDYDASGSLPDYSGSLPDYNEADFSCCPTDIDLQMVAARDRHRVLTAKIFVPVEVEQVWQTLTDYEGLASFIPNLAESNRIQHPNGGIRLEQIGSQSMLRFKFCARVVLDMVENFPSQLHFEMVEGDFRTFKGCWQLEPATDAATNQSGTQLTYHLTVCPSRIIPVRLIEQRLGNNLCENLMAIRDRAIKPQLSPT